MRDDPRGTEISAIRLNPRLSRTRVRGQARRRIRPIPVSPVASNSMLAGSGTARISPNAKSLSALHRNPSSTFQRPP